MDFEENNGKKKNCNTVWICLIINTCEYFFCHWDIYNSLLSSFLFQRFSSSNNRKIINSNYQLNSINGVVIEQLE